MLNLEVVNNAICYTFDSDGVVPNSKLPVLIYRKALDLKTFLIKEAEKELSELADQNEWYLDWLGSVYMRTHYHSTAHETLIVLQGNGLLRLGGSKGVIVKVGGGDVIIIPAGVGHQRLKSSGNFSVFGLYPKGQKWDMQWALRKTCAVSAEIVKKVPLPKIDPIFGDGGQMRKYWI